MSEENKPDVIKKIKHQTILLRNLGTGKPFIFEVDPEKIEFFERIRKLVKEGGSLTFRTEREYILGFEFQLFSSYNKVLKIFMENGYSDDLINHILLDFGLEQNICQKFIESDRFVASIKPWFTGVAQDGGRAVCVLRIVYCKTLSYFRSLDELPKQVFEDFGAIDEYFIELFAN